MSQYLSEEHLIRDYFLNGLPENEQDNLETRLLDEPELYITSRLIEGELIEEYSRGVLPPDDRLRLEEGLLKSPQQYIRVQLTRTLLQKADAPVRHDEELNELTKLEALNLRRVIEEEVTARKYVTMRYQTLIDRKYEQGLSQSENEELEGLKAALDEMDKPYYDKIIQRLRKLVEERGV